MGEAATPKSDAKEDADAARKLQAAVERLLARPAAVSEGNLVVAGRPGTLRYEARVEFLPVLADGFDGATGEPQAAVMVTSYRRHGTRLAERPVCFAFNGGPGSASQWLHLGALGPKRVVVPDDGSAPRAPYVVVDNALSWLDHFDLVFVDPPHTGWSLTASEAARKRMLSVDGDVSALAEVIRTWLSRQQRWASPLYLAGESYGTTRCAALADRLLGMGVGLAGLIFVSCAMDLQSLVFAPSNDLPFALFVPAMAHTAQYHGMLRGAPAASPEAARQASQDFVDEDYVAALHLGARLDGRRRTRIAKRLAELLGLPLELVEARNLRIDDQTCFTELLRPRGRILGRLDSRCSAPMGGSQGHAWEFDPGIEAIEAPFTMATMAYYGQTLGVVLEQRYEAMNMAAHKAWNWNRGEAQGNAFASTSPDLARAMRRHPHLKVLVASGRYDLGTPYSASDWSLAHLDLPAEVMGRITHRYYDAGHMMYTRSADLAKLRTDLANWMG